MNKDTVNWSVYWLGIGFIVGCIYAAMSSCAPPAHAEDMGSIGATCLGLPPACDYGMVPICWCPSGATKCFWFCISDGRAVSCGL